jgi:thiamine biosynthesis protein ThiC
MGQTLMANFCKSIAGLLILTPAEHLHLPNLEEDKEAIIHAKICQHYIGLIYKDKSCLEVEKMFRTKPDSCNNNANLFGQITDLKTCNMCGDFCPLKKIDKKFRKDFKVTK